MKLVSGRAINLREPSVPVIVPVKNEYPLVMHFLDHYRKLGVCDFIFIDNGSTDGTIEFLLSQQDCYVFETDENFREANYGMAWVNKLISTYCVGRWCIFVDCDEFLVYPDSELVKIQDYCALVGKSGRNTVYAAMIDMYSEDDFLSVPVESGLSPFETMSYFDSDYLFRSWPLRPWDSKPEQFNLQVLGGPRVRLLSSFEIEISRGALYYTLCNQIDRIIDFIPYGSVPFVAKFWPAEMPAQQKRPINFVNQNFSYINNHSCTNDLIFGELTSLLHFKICQDLKRKLQQRDVISLHYRRGLSYHQLQSALERFGNKSLMYAGSRKFSSSRDLVNLGLIGGNVAKLWNNDAVRAVRTGVVVT